MASFAAPEVAAIAVVAVLAFWMLGAHNRLVRLRQAIAAAFAQVDAQMRQRHALLGEFIDAFAERVSAIAEALAALDAARQQARVAADRAALKPASASRLASLALAEQVLQRAVAEALAGVEAAAASHDDARLRETAAALEAALHRLVSARDAFNAAVSAYNASAHQFPTRVVAALFGFRPAGLL